VRAVIDTNVLLSGLLWFGPPHRLIELVRDGTLTLIASPALLAEFSEVISRPKFQAIVARSATDVDQLMAELQLLAEVLDPAPLSGRISRDPDDDMILALATAAGADLVISGDADLLVVAQYGNIRIVTPAEALELIATK
jgi:putative PIN family toxin of toxin-antitoxin system